jgi:hypothetical protein
MLEATNEEIARFMCQVDRLPSGCWFWMGARSRGRGNKKPYGSFWHRGTTVRAHRFASEVLGGVECPPDQHRDHECRFSLCVNPDHIHVVPKLENQRRRHNGHCVAHPSVPVEIHPDEHIPDEAQLVKIIGCPESRQFGIFELGGILMIREGWTPQRPRTTSVVTTVGLSSLLRRTAVSIIKANDGMPHPEALGHGLARLSHFGDEIYNKETEE